MTELNLNSSVQHLISEMLNKQKQNSFKSPWIPILLTSNLFCTPAICNAFTVCQQIDNVHISCHCPSNSSYLSLHCFTMKRDIEHVLKNMLHDQSFSLSKVKFLQPDSPAIVSSFTANKTCHISFITMLSYMLFTCSDWTSPHSPHCV